MQVNEKNFSISKNTGFVTYTDDDRIWKNATTAHYIKNREMVVKTALEFFKSVNDSVKKLIQNDLDIPILFPEKQNLRPSVVRAVFSPGKLLADHWLCNFSIYLPTGFSKMIQVVGASIEIRIDPSKRIIGLSSRWRPIEGIKKDVELLPLPKKEKNEQGEHSNHNVHGHANNSSNKDKPNLFYPMAGENQLQNILAPFYTTAEPGIFLGHHGTVASVFPATKYSIMVGIKTKFEKNSVELEAEVLHRNTSNPKFKFYWSVWQLDSGIVGYKDWKQGKKICVKNGIYEVHLGVEMISEKRFVPSSFVEEVIYQRTEPPSEELPSSLPVG